MNLYSFSVLCFAYGVLLICILTMVKRRDRLAWRFFHFSISVFCWGTLFSLWVSQQYPREVTLELARISQLPVMFIPITWLHFVFVFIEKKEPFKGFYLINYLIALFLVPFNGTEFIFSDLRPVADLKYSPIPGMLYNVHTLQFFTLVPYGTFHLVKAYFKAEGSRKIQICYFALGTFIGFFAGSTIYLPFYGVSFPLYLLALMPLYPILTGIALIRYGLFDVQQIADAFQREKITALGIMAASLNHEMRNPLYIAKGKIETYKAVEQSKTKTDEMVDSVSHQLDRTLDIMQRFSDFSKPASMSKKEKVVWADFFKDVTDLVSHALYKKNIELKADFEEGISLLIHRRQFEEIMVNLLINASQALGEQGGIIEVKAYQAKEKFIIEVSDNGPGISQETQKQIFEPFITTKEKGTGLGLYITKQLVERNAGKISIQSNAGRGTTFVLQFKNEL